MKEIDFSLKAKMYNLVSELNQDEQELMKEATTARNNAYAPYSKFKVGAALLLDNGEIITGNNQENAAYPSGMCAERVAIWSAGAKYPNMVVKKIAITAASSEIEVKNPVGPCGACRQALYEYEFNQKEPIEIIFMGETGKIIKVNSLASLLPFSFDSSYL
jgi:cytidine deaminase